MQDHPNPLRREGLIGRVAPFAGAAILAFALVPLGGGELDRAHVEAMLLTAAVIGGALAIPWSRLPTWWQAAPPLTYIAVVALLRSTEGGNASGYDQLLLLPVVWLALYGTQRELIAGQVAAVIVLLGPAILIGAPRYPPELELRRAILWIGMSSLVGFTIQRLVRNTRRRTAEAAQRERELSDAQARFDQAFDTAPIGMAVAELDGRVSRANEAYCRMLGLAESEVLGLRFSVYTHPDDQATDRAVVARLNAGEISKYQGEKRFIHRDGSTVHVLLSVTITHDAAGQPVQYFAQVQDITARKQAEAALLADEQRFRGLVDSAPDAMVIVDREGRIQLVNSKTEKLFGYAREQLVGEPVELLVPKRFRELHRQHRNGYLDEPAARPMGADLDLHAVRRDGSEFPVEIGLSPLETADGTLISSAIRDISERRRAEEDIRRLAQIVESSDDAILGCTLQGRITSWNRGAERIFGFSAGEVIGQLLTELVPQHRLGEERRVIKRILAGEPVQSYEAEGLAKDGRLVDLSLTVSPIRNSEGEPAAVAVIASDVSEQKRARDEAERIKNEFFSLVSHEFRTPLSSIIGYLEVLREGAGIGLTDERRDEFLDVIKRNSERLLRLVGDMLLAGKIQAGRFSIEARVVNLGELADHCIRALTPDATDKELELVLNDQARPELEADSDRLAQLLDNLVANAIKYTPSGGRIEVTLSEQAGKASVAVMNTGAYMTPEELEHIFEPFFRASNATAVEVPGVGLGLVISKSIVEAHHGELSVASVEGVGTTFRFTLPLRQGTAADVTDQGRETA